MVCFLMSYVVRFAGMGRRVTDRVQHPVEVDTGRSRMPTAQRQVQAMMQLAMELAQPRLAAQAIAVR